MRFIQLTLAMTGTELAETLLSRPLTVAWSRGTGDAPAERPERNLGLSPGLQAWWAGKHGSNSAWQQEEETARASYSR